MATSDDTDSGLTTKLDGKYLLVSDSNEIGNQYDSKKLSKADLVNIAEDNLFKRHLDIMSQYLTKTQYQTYKGIIDEKLQLQLDLWDALKAQEWSGKFTAVDGQIILINVDEFNKLNKARMESDPPKTAFTPMQYIRECWHITSEYSITQLKDCMLRGITQVDSQTREQVIKTGNDKIGLKEVNIPPHMHHSSITTNANIRSMEGSEAETDKTRLVNEAFAYDLFYNDSFATGVDFNELNGEIDTFNVKNTGITSGGQDETPRLDHNNLPRYTKYYAFVIHKGSNT